MARILEIVIRAAHRKELRHRSGGASMLVGASRYTKIQWTVPIHPLIAVHNGESPLTCADPVPTGRTRPLHPQSARKLRQSILNIPRCVCPGEEIGITAAVRFQPDRPVRPGVHSRPAGARDRFDCGSFSHETCSALSTDGGAAAGDLAVRQRLEGPRCSANRRGIAFGVDHHGRRQVERQDVLHGPGIVPCDLRSSVGSPATRTDGTSRFPRRRRRRAPRLAE